MDDGAPIPEGLREQVEVLERSAALGYLLSAVVHEVNNPLSVLIIGADQLRFAAETGQGVGQGIESLVRQAERIVSIARNLQDLVRAGMAERETVDLAALLPRSVEISAWLHPGRPAPSLDAPPGPLPVEIPAGLFVQICRFVTSALHQLGEGPEPVRISASVEEISLIALPSLAARSPRRTYAVLRFVRGRPVGDAVSVKELLADFFGRPHAWAEVELMAAWELVRKANGRMNVGRDPGAGAEVQVLLPLRPPG